MDVRQPSQLEAALDYASRGIAVLPCHYRYPDYYRVSVIRAADACAPAVPV
jgi:hypothetical protein